MKKMKILKIALLIIFILLIVFLTITIRRMLIIKELSAKADKSVTSKNHYEKIINNSIETETITEYYCKEDKAVMFLTTTIKNTGEKRKLIKYFKGEKANIYIETKEDKVALLNSNAVPSKVIILRIDYDNNFWNLLKMAVMTPIRSIEYNGKECYCLNSLIARECYIEKKTGLILRAIDGQVEDSNGNKTDVIVEYNYEFNNVEDSIFTEPEISEYKIQENN